MKKSAPLFAALVVILSLSHSLFAGDETPSGEPKPEPFKAAACGDAVEALYRDELAKDFPQFDFDFLRSSATFPLECLNGEHEVSVYGTTRLTPYSAHWIFTHQYDKDNLELWGAKGLVIRNRRENRLETLFWQTGLKREGLEFHHRDGLAEANRFLQTPYNRAHRYFEAFGSGADELFRLLPHFGPLESLVSLNEDMVQLGQLMRDQSKAASDNLSRDRRQENFEPEDLASTMGLQLTVIHDREGKMQIKYLDVDSSITSAQINQKRPLTPDDFVEMLGFAIEAIDPVLRKFKHIRVRAKNAGQVQELDGLARAKLGIGLQFLPKSVK